MNISEFAEKYSLKVRRDSCNYLIIQGRASNGDPNRPLYANIFDGYENGVLGVLLVFPTSRHWTNARKKLEDAGLVIRQNADTEGIATFDPTNVRQSRLAMAYARIFSKRQAAPATAKQLAARAAFTRQQPAIEFAA